MMMQAILTRKQSETYDFIRSYWASNGEAPTYREIGEALGISSKSVVHQRIEQLQRKGYIATTGAGLKRHLRITDSRSVCPCCGRALASGGEA